MGIGKEVTLRSSSPYGPTAPARSLRRVLGLVFGIAVVGLMLGTGVAYLASSGGTASSVVTTRGLGTGGTGAAISVTPVSVSITTSKGHAQLDAGQETARIAIASGASGTLLVHVNWLDPQDAYKVLHSPSSYILAGLYQEASTTTSGGSCTSGEYKVDDSTNGWLCLESLSGGNTLGVLTKASADAVLQAPVSGLTNVYVLTSIYVSNNIPAGQQGTSLQFYVSAELAG